MSSDSNNVQIPSINQDNKEYICISIFEEDWYVKITDGYGHSDYLNIRENCNKDVPINDPKDIFENNFLILPEPYYDNITQLIIKWEIADKQHIYSIRNLPEEYWHKFEEPKCFESEEIEADDDDTPEEGGGSTSPVHSGGDGDLSESESETTEKNLPRESFRIKTFFDRIVENL